ncbi:hypothetical protein A1E_04435 [Rickettsia canadensis str. McKiel]|uniref:Uncharacterized protein n=2 Tax=Rickettsia canadensis TaxID=788 RepID=A8EZM9_RICCK|nr:hypothetical protein A1E_04435 [Rickettsia canadensis str. McKiel]AFB21373.1 hypothetical protein RCA_04080 [Rickettsia canadensis str. CA410]
MLNYCLVKTNKIFVGIIIPISKKSYNLQQKEPKLNLFRNLHRV